MIQMGWKHPPEPSVCPSTLQQHPISHGEAGISPAAVSGASPDQDAGNARAATAWQNHQPDGGRRAVATTRCESGKELDPCINSLPISAHSMTSPSGEHPTMETKPQECSWVCRLSSPLQKALTWLKYSQASKLVSPPLPPAP